LGQKLTVTDLHKLPPIILEDLFGVMTPKKTQKERSFGSFDKFSVE
jgi:hypothetical protein